MSADDVAERLAALLTAPLPDWTGGPDSAYWLARATALLPVIDAIAEERAQEAVKSLRAILSDLVEAVGRGDEVGLPEAYRSATAALRGEGR